MSANEMFERYTLAELYEIMAANKVYADIIEQASKGH